MVIFCFSKNRCDKSADSLTGTDLTSSSEKSEIRIFCDKAFSRLKGSDRNLPQVWWICNRFFFLGYSFWALDVKEFITCADCQSSKSPP